MDDILEIKKPLAALILLTRLQQEGFDISTATILDIQRVMANIDEKEIKHISDLKFILAPVICRNKEEQAKFYDHFDEYVKEVKKQRQAVTEHKKEEEQKRKHAHLKKMALVTAALLVVLLAVWIFISPSPHRKPYIIIQQGIKGNEITIKDTILFRATLKDTLRKKQYQLNWHTDDTGYTNRRSLQKNFPTSGTHTVKLSLLKDGQPELDSLITVNVLCEKTPSVYIQRELAKQSQKQKKYTAIIINPSPDSNSYRYVWYLDDSLVSLTGPTFENFYPSSKAYMVKVKVTGGLHCSTDSLINNYTEFPPVNFTVEKTAPPITPPALKIAWKNLTNLSLLTLLVPASVIFLIFYRRKKTAKGKSGQPFTGPYSIEFQKQEDKICTDEGISQLADILRKRHVSEEQQLNIRQSIQKTIRAAGFPSFVFRPRTKPTDFLFFIDKEFPDSHTINLFEYMAASLKKEQVNLTLYSFYKEPLLLSNKSLNHNQLPINNIYSLYPDTILFIFTEADSFFRPGVLVLNTHLLDKLKNWSIKFIITPLSKNDWGSKEKLLQKAGFSLIPADMNSHERIEEEINQLTDPLKPKQKLISASYSARFINFYEWSSIEKYIDEACAILSKQYDKKNNSQLIRDWVCSLAVYPRLNWELTIAIGKSLEIARSRPGWLVNYTNLLILSRISWMHDGQLNEGLRLEMLKKLDDSTEALARRTIVKMLEDFEKANKLTDDSLVAYEFKIYKTSNRFLLHTYDNNNELLPAENQLMKTFVKEGYLDLPLETLLNHHPSTLLKSRRNSSRSITPQQYFKIIPPLIRYLLGGLLFILIAVVGILYMKSSDQFHFFSIESPKNSWFILQNSQLKIPGYYQFTVKVNNKDYPVLRAVDTLTVAGLPTDTTQKGTLQIEGTSASIGPLVYTTNFMLGYQGYKVSFDSVPTPLEIRYNDEAAYRAIENELRNSLAAYEILARPAQAPGDSSEITYHETDQLADVLYIRDIVRQKTGIVADTNYVAIKSNPPAAPVLFLHFPTGCTDNIEPNALPAELHEIWEGISNNSYLSIDLSQRYIYYAVKNKKNFERYQIIEACFDKGIYRLLIRGRNGLRSFYVEKPTASGFNLSACPDLGPSVTVEQARQIKQCNEFIPMRLYYEQVNNVIYVPENKINYERKEQNKISSIPQQLLKININQSINSSAVADLTVHVNTFDKSNILEHVSLVQKNFNFYTRIQMDNKFQWRNFESFTATPFDRDYLSYSFISPIDEDPISSSFFKNVQSVLYKINFNTKIDDVMELEWGKEGRNLFVYDSLPTAIECTNNTLKYYWRYLKESKLGAGLYKLLESYGLGKKITDDSYAIYIFKDNRLGRIELRLFSDDNTFYKKFIRSLGINTELEIDNYQFSDEGFYYFTTTYKETGWYVTHIILSNYEGSIFCNNDWWNKSKYK